MQWFEKYEDKLGVRYKTFHKLFSIAIDRELKNFVETGTSRGKDKFYYLRPKVNWKDGMSTILFAEYVKLNKGQLWTCDIDAKNIHNASLFLKDFNLHANLIVSDSLKFLEDFNETIDVLYLDSHDGNLPGANEHQLREAQLSIDKMNSNGLIMLDDKGQKTELSIPFLISKGWKIIFETDHQVIFRKVN